MTNSRVSTHTFPIKNYVREIFNKYISEDYEYAKQVRVGARLTLAGSSSAGILGLWICGDILTLLVKMKGLNTERCGSGVPVNQWQLGLWGPWLITDTWPKERHMYNVTVKVKRQRERGKKRMEQRHPWNNIIPTTITNYWNSFIIISFTLKSL